MMCSSSNNKWEINVAVKQNLKLVLPFFKDSFRFISNRVLCSNPLPSYSLLLFSSIWIIGLLLLALFRATQTNLVPLISIDLFHGNVSRTLILSIIDCKHLNCKHGLTKDPQIFQLNYHYQIWVGNVAFQKQYDSRNLHKTSGCNEYLKIEILWIICLLSFHWRCNKLWRYHTNCNGINLFRIWWLSKFNVYSTDILGSYFRFFQ